MWLPQCAKSAGQPEARSAGHRVAAVLQRGQQLAVVDVEHFARDVQHLGDASNLGRAAPGEWPARLAPMADVAIGDRNKLDMMARGGPERGRAAGLNLAIIRMRAEADDAEFAVVCGRLGGRGFWLRGGLWTL